MDAYLGAMNLIDLFFIGGGFIGLIYGAELLVRGSSRLALASGFSPLVVGLTVVAFGTSAPELAVSLSATLKGQAGISVGNILGSNIFNILVILGISAMIMPLAVQSKMLRFEMPFLLGCTAVMYAMSIDHNIARWEGVVLTILLITFLVILLKSGRSESAEVVNEFTESMNLKPGEVTPKPSIPWSLFIAIVGLALLIVGSRYLVIGATSVAMALGVSDFIIGVTIIAVGTSLPEAAASFLAALKGERDIAIGNIVGSNLFNIVFILGSTALVSSSGVPIEPDVLGLDLPLMVASTFILLPIMYAGLQISRIDGLILFSYYCGYFIYIVGREGEFAWAESFLKVYLFAYVPITLIYILGGAGRDFIRSRR